MTVVPIRVTSDTNEPKFIKKRIPDRSFVFRVNPKTGRFIIPMHRMKDFEVEILPQLESVLTSDGNHYCLEGTVKKVISGTEISRALSCIRKIQHRAKQLDHCDFSLLKTANPLIPRHKHWVYLYTKILKRKRMYFLQKEEEQYKNTALKWCDEIIKLIEGLTTTQLGYPCFGLLKQELPEYIARWAMRNTKRAPLVNQFFPLGKNLSHIYVYADEAKRFKDLFFEFDHYDFLCEMAYTDRRKIRLLPPFTRLVEQKQHMVKTKSSFIWNNRIHVVSRLYMAVTLGLRGPFNIKKCNFMQRLQVMRDWLQIYRVRKPDIERKHFSLKTPVQESVLFKPKTAYPLYVPREGLPIPLLRSIGTFSEPRVQRWVYNMYVANHDILLGKLERYYSQKRENHRKMVDFFISEEEDSKEIQICEGF